LAYIFNIEPKFILKLKQLVSLICSSKPYELNISKLSAKVEINRNTLYQYIYYLNRGKIFNILHQNTKGDNIFSKPSKLYLANTNLYFAYCSNVEVGTLRDSFFVNQLKNYLALHKNLSFLDDNFLASKKGDFFIKQKYTFEITKESSLERPLFATFGGANKSFKRPSKATTPQGKARGQIKDVKNSFVVADDIEVGLKAKIPLWLFGFLY
jgi:hypothetical protein